MSPVRTVPHPERDDRPPAPVCIERLFHALCEPARRAIIEHLGRSGACSVSRLAKRLEITPTAVIQHLKVLESSGLVRTSKFGRVRTCGIEPAGFAPIERWIKDRKASWKRRFDRLESPPGV